MDPTSEQLAIIRALSDGVLRASVNPSYMKLVKENIALKSRIDDLQMQLIPALSTKPACTNAIRSTQHTQIVSQPQTIRKSLNKKDFKFPNVKHCISKTGKMADPSDTDTSDGDNDAKNDTSEKDCGVIAFLETESGLENIDPSNIPVNWSLAGATLRDRFRNDLEDKFPFLCLCAGRWKVEKLWKRNYHRWKRSFLTRQAKREKLESENSAGGAVKTRQWMDDNTTEAGAESHANKKARNGKHRGQDSVRNGNGKAIDRSAVENAINDSKAPINPLEGFTIKMRGYGAKNDDYYGMELSESLFMFSDNDQKLPTETPFLQLILQISPGPSSSPTHWSIFVLAPSGHWSIVVFAPTSHWSTFVFVSANHWSIFDSTPASRWFIFVFVPGGHWSTFDFTLPAFCYSERLS